MLNSKKNNNNNNNIGVLLITEQKHIYTQRKENKKTGYISDRKTDL